MAIRNAKIRECDNPSCLSESELYTDSPHGEGYTISKGFYDTGNSGGRIPKTEVCSLECLVAGVKARIEESHR